MTKYIFVTGGVVSGLGKGITAASVALLLKARGYKVFMQKFDPYINVNPGRMSPYQHGEVYVTADGSETDLDLGHYERFIDEELNYTSNITMGRVYANVIEKEQKGDYGGGTVQIVPHLTNEIKKKIKEAAATSKADFVITEIGGTIGDLEALAFVEALRQMRDELGKKETIFIHMTLVPYIFGSGELKSKPTQHSVIQMRSLGIQPDVIVTRSPFNIGNEIKGKIALFCSIPEENIVEAIDVKNIYQIPLNFYHNKLDQVVLKQFDMKVPRIKLKYWEDLVNQVDSLDEELNIALVGKYVELHDAYLSVMEALKHAAYSFNKKINIQWIDSEALEKKKLNQVFKKSQAIIVPAGFGEAGSEGAISAIKYAREEKIPFFGISSGMQLALVEFARNVCGIRKAASREIEPDCEEAIIIEAAKKLGNNLVVFEKDSLIKEIYKKKEHPERHRHEHIFNLKYKAIFEKNNLVFSAYDNKKKTVEAIELKDHPFFIACQYHPEFLSRPNRAHPLFTAFIAAAVKRQDLLKKKKN